MALMFKELPVDFSGMYEAIDPAHMYNMAITGAYVQHMEGRGDFRVYIPEGIQHSCKAVYVFVPGDADPAEFLEKTGWIETSDAEKFMLVALSPLGEKWDASPEGADVKFALDAVTMAQDRKYYNINQMFRYIIGYKDSAAAALNLALARAGEFAAIVVAGSISGAKKVIEYYAEKPSDAEYIPLKDVPMPAWMITGAGCSKCGAAEFNEDQQAFVDFYTRADKTEKEPYKKGDTWYYMPDPANAMETMSEQLVSRVLVTTGKCPIKNRMAGEIYRELMVKTVRPKAILNGDLHPFRTLEQWGVEECTMEVDGFTRQYLKYIPSYVKRNPDYKAPLVVYLHGGSNTGIANSYGHEWYNVAEVRNFVVLCPTGAMRRFDAAIPHPAWNASRQENIQNDLKFIRAMIEKVEGELNIDKSRVYVTGHSMGSAMTQQCCLTMPDVFAAGASNSGIIAGGFLGSVDLPGVRDDLDIPVWIQMGEKDIGGGTFAANPKAYNTVKYWTEREGLDNTDSPAEYVDGPYRTKVYCNAEKVPMLTYVTTDLKPHAQTAADCWIYYDQFFCRFSRAEDGSVVYMGRKVKKSH